MQEKKRNSLEQRRRLSPPSSFWVLLYFSLSLVGGVALSSSSLWVLLVFSLSLVGGVALSSSSFWVLLVFSLSLVGGAALSSFWVVVLPSSASRISTQLQ